LRFFGIGELAAGEELKEEYGDEEGGEALEVLCGVTTGRRARRVVTTTVDVADAPDLDSFEGEKKSKSVDDLDGEESMVNGKEYKEALPEQFRNGGCACGTLHVGQSYFVIQIATQDIDCITNEPTSESESIPSSDPPTGTQGSDCITAAGALVFTTVSSTCCPASIS